MKFPKIRIGLLVKFMADPGFRLTITHNICFQLFCRRYTRSFGLLLWNVQVMLSACHISPRVRLPSSTRFPHPVGIVIGDGVVIGESVTIYQGVTLGRASVNKPGYPRIGAEAILYANAVVVGDVVLPPNAVVKANALISPKNQFAKKHENNTN